MLFITSTCAFQNYNWLVGVPQLLGANMFSRPSGTKYW
jgi:hypothetical protein